MSEQTSHSGSTRVERQDQALAAILNGLEQLEPGADAELQALLRRHPKDGRGFFSKSDLIEGLRRLRSDKERDDLHGWIEYLRQKPIRSLSGVTPVTVLTKPFPCPGRCIFCPNDVRMPKSYIASEPGAQRAETHRFDPYLQTYWRLEALAGMGHPVAKVELIILGGTWSYYPEPYQLWFIARCFDALNDFSAGVDARGDVARPDWNFRELELADASLGASAYNRTISTHLTAHQQGRLVDAAEEADWSRLEQAQHDNERASSRCVGLVVETRPDLVSDPEVERLRRLGATKVQVGIQSLRDEILESNQRGHDVARSRLALRRLRAAGFKIHAHWMPNLLGATPETDCEDFEALFADPDLRPDELKIYPCSLIEDTGLMEHYRAGSWRPYGEDELLEVLVHCLEQAPEYCRLTRVVRDIPSQEIVVGNKKTNFREVAERALARRGGVCRDIRARELRGASFDVSRVRLEALEFESGIGREVFLQFLSAEDRLVAFLRLSLPEQEPYLEELSGRAVIREVHVYGPSADVGEQDLAKAQHSGLGRKLIEAAATRAREAGYPQLAVISAVGTRPYYRRLGFVDGRLYQHRLLSA